MWCNNDSSAPTGDAAATPTNSASGTKKAIQNAVHSSIRIPTTLPCLSVPVVLFRACFTPRLRNMHAECMHHTHIPGRKT